MATNPLLADPRQNPFRRKPMLEQPLPSSRPAAAAMPQRGNTVLGSKMTDAGLRRSEAYEASAGGNPRGGGAAGRQEGESIGDFNKRIAKWDAGHRRASGRGFNQGHVEGDYWVANDQDLENSLYSDEFTSNSPAELARGGGGGGSGAGGPGSGAVGPDGQPRNFEGELQGYITDVLGGKQGPYTDDVIAGQKASAFDDFAGGLTAKNRAEAQRAKRSGNLYSASTGSAMRENENAGRQALGQRFQDVDAAAVSGNFGARMDALGKGLQKLESDRALAIAQAANATDRERIAKEYDGLIESTQMKISSEEKLAQSAQGAAGAAAGRGRTWDLEDEMRRRNWDLEDRAYEENWRLYDAGLSADGDY